MLQTYLNKINSTLNSMVKSFDENYSVILSDKYAVDLDNEVITYALLIDSRNDNFYKNFVSRFPCVENFNILFLSILHEIGHLETQDEMENDTEIRNTELDEETYFNLYNERIATDYAGFWVQDNFEIAKKYNDEIEKVLFEMYDRVLD
jgi:hypothetical protein